MNRLIDMGHIQPILSKTFDLDTVGDAAYQVHHNQHEGKLGVLCLAPRAGLGVTDLEKRERIGVDRIKMFETHAAELEVS